jgi:hypothetical protein
MARILVTSEESWYDELAIITSYYESEFERKIRQHIASVFPDYYTISFKLTVEAEQREPKKPDLAMIRKDYKDWWIVEVELGGHTLDHVREQVIVFREGIYNRYKVAEYIFKKCKTENSINLDEEKLIEMIKAQQPNVLVIVDDAKPDWEAQLKKYDVQVCIFQVFLNTNGYESYRLDGKYPEVAHSESHCRYDPKIPNMLIVLSPTILDKNGNEDGRDEIKICYNGKMSKWKRIDDNGAVYLKSIGKINPIPIRDSYVLFVDAHGRYNLKLN